MSDGSSKRYRTYRGGRAGAANDPEASRFSFPETGTPAVDAPRPATPEGMPAPDMQTYRSGLPGRRVATAPADGGGGGRRGWRGRLHMGWKRGIGLGLLAFVLVVGGWLYLGYRSFDQEIAKANGRVTRQTRAALTPSGGSLLTTPQITIILGSDSRGAGSTQRADSILLFRTDPSRGLVSMLSIPRDLWVAIPGHGHAKINAAYAYGGPALLIRTVDQLTGLHVNHVVLVNFSGFEDLINSLGGVTLYNPYKVVSSQPFDGLYWHFAKGWIHLDGRHALAYSRIRHTTNPRDSDITREERQQRVVTALAHKLVSLSTLFNLPSVGADIAKPLTTDLTANDLLEIAWVKFRASRNLSCHLGGAPEIVNGQDALSSVPENISVIGMFLGTVAPQPPSPNSLYAPGCTG